MICIIYDANHQVTSNGKIYKEAKLTNKRLCTGACGINYILLLLATVNMYGGEEEGEDPASFAIYFAEGETLAKQGEYRKAIESYTKVRSSLTGVVQ